MKMVNANSSTNLSLLSISLCLFLSHTPLISVIAKRAGKKKTMVKMIFNFLIWTLTNEKNVWEKNREILFLWLLNAWWRGEFVLELMDYAIFLGIIPFNMSLSFFLFPSQTIFELHLMSPCTFLTTFFGTELSVFFWWLPKSFIWLPCIRQNDNSRFPTPSPSF